MAGFSKHGAGGLHGAKSTETASRCIKYAGQGMLVPNQQRGGHGHGKMSCKQEHSLQRNAVRQSLQHLGLLLSGSGTDWHT